MKVLLDTNVISEVRKPHGNPAIRASLAAIDDSDQFLSVISIGEIAYGIARLERGKRRRQLEEWLAQAELHFAGHLLTVDSSVCRLWGELAARAADAGRPLSVADGLIAATAVHHGLRLMTRNVADFQATGVVLINPWEDSKS